MTASTSQPEVVLYNLRLSIEKLETDNSHLQHQLDSMAKDNTALRERVQQLATELDEVTTSYAQLLKNYKKAVEKSPDELTDEQFRKMYEDSLDRQKPERR